MIDLLLVLLPLFTLFCLWLGYRILEKAGLDGRWTLILLIPVVNVVMIWLFAFCDWPLLPKHRQSD